MKNNMKTFHNENFFSLYFSIPKRRWQSVDHSGTGGFYFLLYAFFPPLQFTYISCATRRNKGVSEKKIILMPRTGLVRQESFERGQGMGVRGFRPGGGVRDLNKENL